MKWHKGCPEQIQGINNRHATQADEGRHDGGSAARPKPSQRQ
jgi:hypothetical protein